MEHAQTSFQDEDLELITLDEDLLVVGFQTLTSNSIEYAAAAGESPIARVLGRVHQPDAFADIPDVHPSGTMIATYTNFMDVDGADPAYTYTMGLRVTDLDGERPAGMGSAEIPAGRYLVLDLANASGEMIPAAWAWLLQQFAERRVPWDRSFAGDFEVYRFDPAASTLGVAIHVGLASDNGV